MATQFVHTNDLEIAMATQMLILQEGSRTYPLAPGLSLDLTSYGIDTTTQELLSEFAALNGMPLLEWIGHGNLVDFKITRFSEYNEKMKPETKINVLFGEQLSTPSTNADELAQQLKDIGYPIRAVTVQYLLDHGELFLQALQQLMQAVARRISTEAFAKANQEAKKFISDRKASGESTDPLLLAESIMGKRFRNRGPYAQYYLVPTFFGVTIRIFQHQQVLFVKVPEKAISDQQITDMWKAISDPTRYRILQIIAHNETTRAVDIVAELNLSAPTISHHLDTLRHAGMIHTEPSGRSKYYSINHNAIRQLQMILDGLILK